MSLARCCPSPSSRTAASYSKARRVAQPRAHRAADAHPFGQPDRRHAQRFEHRRRPIRAIRRRRREIERRADRADVRDDRTERRRLVVRRDHARARGSRAADDDRGCRCRRPRAHAVRRAAALSASRAARATSHIAPTQTTSRTDGASGKRSAARLPKSRSARTPASVRSTTSAPVNAIVASAASRHGPVRGPQCDAGDTGRDRRGGHERLQHHRRARHRSPANRRGCLATSSRRP